MIKKCIRISPIILFILAVINSKTLFNGALSGIQLWMFTVVPTLFPFLILSDIMVRLNTTDYISALLSPITRPLLGISPSGNYAIITGLLCGYPVGAKTCADLVKENKISIHEGNYLLTFVNNASPAFISSYIVNALLFGTCSALKIAFLIYIPSIITAFILNPFFRKKLKNTKPINNSDILDSAKLFSLEDAIFSTVNTLLRIGSYIIIFSILCEFIKLLPSHSVKMALSGLLEITTGTFLVSISTMSFQWKIRLIVFFTSLGGISTLFQTNSMIADSGLSIKWYIIGKIIASVLAFLLCFII